MARARTDAVTQARADVEAARTTLAEWVATRTAAEAELASLESRSGAEVLDDPEAAARLPKIMGELRDTIDIATRAIDVQGVRVTEAESRYLTAEADVLEAPAAAVRAVLAKHQERTAELLALLADHEGAYVPEAWLLQATHEVGAPLEYEVLKSQFLEDRVAAAELPVRILRELAAGREPAGASPEDYPPCAWGPEALVPAPAYLRHAGRTTEELAATQANLAMVEERVADLEARIGRGEVAPVVFEHWTLAPSLTLGEQLTASRRQADGLRKRLDAAEEKAGRSDHA